MDPIRNNESFSYMRVVRLVQEIRVIAVCETLDVTASSPSAPQEELIIIDSIQRPLPIPYNEGQ